MQRAAEKVTPAVGNVTMSMGKVSMTIEEVVVPEACNTLSGMAIGDI